MVMECFMSCLVDDCTKFGVMKSCKQQIVLWRGDMAWFGGTER